MISVIRDLLISEWVIQLYIPRVCRVVSARLTLKDLESRKHEKCLEQILGKRLLFYFENPKMGLFNSYLTFTKRMRCKKIDSLDYSLLGFPLKEPEVRPHALEKVLLLPINELDSVSNLHKSSQKRFFQ